MSVAALPASAATGTLATPDADEALPATGPSAPASVEAAEGVGGPSPACAELDSFACPTPLCCGPDDAVAGSGEGDFGISTERMAVGAEMDVNKTPRGIDADAFPFSTESVLLGTGCAVTVGVDVISEGVEDKAEAEGRADIEDVGSFLSTAGEGEGATSEVGVAAEGVRGTAEAALALAICCSETRRSASRRLYSASDSLTLGSSFLTSGMDGGAAVGVGAVTSAVSADGDFPSSP